MKKNMLSIIILALLVVNIALTAVMMISVIGTMGKTARLIDGIASALSLEMAGSMNAGEGGEEQISLDATAIYQISDELTISLATGADGKAHFCLVSVSLSMNTEHEDYAKYGETMAEREDLIRSEIFSVISARTYEEASANQDLLREEILERIQNLFNSKFIYNVVFREIMFS